MHWFISPPGAHKLQRKVHCFKEKIIIHLWIGKNPGGRREEKSKQENLKKKIRQHCKHPCNICRLSTEASLSCSLRASQSSQWPVLSFYFVLLPESTLSFVGSSVPMWAASSLCYLPLSRDKYLTPGKWMLLISIRTWSSNLLLMFFWVHWGGGE